MSGRRKRDQADAADSRPIRCAIYTRKSSEEGLDQEFNSLDAQREGAEAFIVSQKAEGWVVVPDRYDDGGFSGGSMERPALERLLRDIDAGKIDCVVVYKVDRLSRSLMDFSRILETFERSGVSFVSVTQQFNTTHSMGRLTLNILLSFAQFEREIISERTRDKIAAARRRGKWSGGRPILGYDVDRSGGSPRLVVNPDEANRVREIFTLYLKRGSLLAVAEVLNQRGWLTKAWTTKRGRHHPGRHYDKCILMNLLTNQTYRGKVTYKDEVHEGEHEAIVAPEVWQKVQAKLKENGRGGSPGRRTRHEALLRGLIHCPHCECGMYHHYTSSGSRRYRYYVCGRAMKQGWSRCPSRSVPAGAIEQFVIARLRELSQDDHSDLQDDLRDQLLRLLEVWETSSPAARRELLQQAVNRVEYDGTGGTISVSLHRPPPAPGLRTTDTVEASTS